MPNRTFCLVEHSFTSQAIHDIFVEIHHGTPPEIHAYTEEDYLTGLKTGFLEALTASAMKGFVEKTCWEGEMVTQFPGWVVKPLSSYVQGFMN